MLCLPLLLALVCLLGTAPARPPCPRQMLHPLLQDLYNLDETSAERSARFARSSNISHIIGTTRKLRLIVGKKWHLLIHPDGTVNGTNTNIDSDFSIVQRVSRSHIEVIFQGVATCQYLCMDKCGFLYGSRSFSHECVFNEMIQPQHFNIYSSVKYSNNQRTLYLGFTMKTGVSRKVQTKKGAAVGKASLFASVLTTTVTAERAELAHRRQLGHHLRHQKLCGHLPLLTESKQPDKQRCHKPNKKKKRRCESEEADDCELPPRLTTTTKCENGEDEDECQRRLHMTRKKRKSRTGDEERLKLDTSKDSHRSRRKKFVPTTTESLLWQDHLGDLSSEWTTSSATPN